MPAKKRDYKAEYKKFQSSTKAKKYRAELNKYNRKKGTYGNGDGKDASHKGGKIVGFEAQSKNRGRAEKSRLKKEAKLNENPAAIAAAQRVVVQAKAGKKVSVNTARQSSYAKKDPSAHNKAKGIWQRIKDKFSKKEMLEATYGQMLAKKGKKLNVVFVNGKPKVQIVDLEPVKENTEKAVKDMINRKVVKKGQSNKDRVRAIGQWLDDHSHEVSAKYNDVWIRRIKMGRGGQVQDWWGDTMTMIKNRLGESVNEAEKWKTVGIDVRDIYDYMVSIKKTNPAKFKKDMQNRHLKAIWDRYSKGWEMYKESVNEAKGKKSKVASYNVFGSMRELSFNLKKVMDIIDKDSQYRKLSSELGNFKSVVDKKLKSYQEPLKKVSADTMLESVNEWTYAGDIRHETGTGIKKADKVAYDKIFDKIWKKFGNLGGGFIEFAGEEMGRGKSYVIKWQVARVSKKRGKFRDWLFTWVEPNGNISAKPKGGKSLGVIGNMKNPNKVAQALKDWSDEDLVFEFVNEANIKDIEKVLKTRSAKKIDGMYMDMTTANAIMTVYKALNTSNRKKFEKLPLKKMVDVTWKLVK